MIRDGIGPASVEAQLENWIDTASQYARNADYWRERSVSFLQERAYQTARDKGWYDNAGVTLGDRIALIHSEVSEALEEYRNGHMELYFEKPDKPEGFGTELADAVIRIFDLCGSQGIDLQELIIRKMEYNETREYRHGGKKI